MKTFPEVTLSQAYFLYKREVSNSALANTESLIFSLFSAQYTHVQCLHLSPAKSIRVHELLTIVFFKKIFFFNSIGEKLTCYPKDCCTDYVCTCTYHDAAYLPVSNRTLDVKQTKISVTFKGILHGQQE